MNDTKLKILEVAAIYTQQRGFGGFSYLDLADEIGIKAASIHYYFKSKDDLAIALVEHTHELHTDGFQNMQTSIDRPKGRLEAVIAYFQSYVVEEKFCLCGMLAAELNSVSEIVSQRLESYFNDFQTWLAKQFKEMGYSDSDNKAMSFLSTLEGSLLLARLRKDPDVVRNMLTSYIND
ncbi:MAG: TetR family transcriptional regulator [Proteobacteria bacterium]|nr:TetR family transcriptional regulator [Pseudomonadota bacterium]